ncbi:sodium/proline symporter PutP [Corynebacterium sp. CCUG 71335]|uniref:sodium/proline symporter PutP n=1 Tax=unclassified Corynebacterium TaxID=2624378 RepID=UPI00210ACF9B|nr:MULTISPECIES: sodium/proline symporter PutP [unclassified Corynebacterium]MCQ4619636.1 sodium/proline symporter PutP [Corynebacterium sp. CCUG 71335]MCQ4628349.1 sodium/proline symporter PutP [Corynebacterium sp. CCUG 65737]
MTESTWMIIALVIYLGLMLAIGYYGWRRTTQYGDYVIGGRDLPPFVAGISAGASDMSGWLLMGLPGALFVSGMSELWIVIGLFLGSWANWQWVAPRLRAYSEVANNSITLPSFFENRTHDQTRALRVIAAVIIIFFFTFYVSSGMVAGGRYFESTFDGDYMTGMLIVGAITVIYTFVGGFFAVSYTDVAQGLVMFAALIIVPVMALFAIDNPGGIFSYPLDNPYGPWETGNPDYFNFFTGVSAAAIIGNLAWSLGYMGQPHIITRFMALRSPHEARSGRNSGLIWVGICYIGAVFTAIIGASFFGQTQHSVTDREGFETIFLDMTRVLFHPLFAGLVLTAVLAAIMSTMSSQLLVTSSALVEDLFRGFTKRELPQRTLLIASRVMVVIVALVAILMAANPSETILGLVGFAWAGFGSAFGPVIIASLFWRRLTAPGAMAGMIVGALTVFIWGSIPATSGLIYEMVPGFILATLAMVIVSLATKPDPAAEAEFDRAGALTEYAMAHPEVPFDQALKDTQVRGTDNAMSGHEPR